MGKLRMCPGISGGGAVGWDGWVSRDEGPPPVLGGSPWPSRGARGLVFLVSRSKASLMVCVQGLKERAYASSGEAITSLPVSIPLSTVQPSKLPVSIPLASVVLPSRAEKVVSGRQPGKVPAPWCDWPGPSGSGSVTFPEHTCGQRGVSSCFFPARLSCFLLDCVLVSLECTATPQDKQNPKMQSSLQ